MKRKSPYSLDKNSFKIQSFQEADNNRDYWNEKSYEDRLQAAWYLICCAYDFPFSDSPELERNVFSFRRHLNP